MFGASGAERIWRLTGAGLAGTLLRMPHSYRRLTLAGFCVAALGASALAGQSAQKAPAKTYWGDDVPAGWTGKWPVELQTVAERTEYTRTMTSEQNIEFITALRGKTREPARRQHVHQPAAERWRRRWSSRIRA